MTQPVAHVRTSLAPLMKLVSLTLTLLLAPLSAWAQTDSATFGDLFRKMSAAFSSMNYDGTFVYSHGNHMDTMRIVHAVDGDVERERIVRLDGPSLELIREGDKITCVHPADWKGDIDHRIPVGPFAKAFIRDFSQLNDSYQFQRLGDQRIVGREAEAILIKPMDDLRYGYQVWMDKESGLLLKSELFHAGTVLERFQFTQLKLDEPVPESELQLGIKGEVIEHYPLVSSAAQVEPTPSSWKLEWVPNGFRMSIQGIRRNGGEGSMADTLTYSDGMSAFSVFVEKVESSPEALDSETVTQKGATVAVGRLVSVKNNRHMVTVVGEVPLTTARRLAASVVPVNSLQ